MTTEDSIGQPREIIDSRYFRDVLSSYPTGVCVITAQDDAGNRHGLVVGSFTSISLDPPLVGFFPDRKSSTWPKIEACGGFCVNILGAHQPGLCSRFAAKGADKFGDLAHGSTPSGQPLLDYTLAWIDCAIDKVVEVGDHWLVVGAVKALGVGSDRTPLMFFRGKYHDLAAMS